MRDLLGDIVHWYEVNEPACAHQRYKWPDHRGEFWGVCAFHADRKPGSFSFSERGYHCFSCGEHGSLRRLAEQIGIEVGRSAPIVMLSRARPRPARIHDWQRDPDYWRRFLPLPPEAREYYHSRGFTDGTIESRRLGYGVLPDSRCPHPRAILPVFEDGRLVAIRGRAILGSDHFDKWLCSGGSRVALYGAESLSPDRPVVITEAPYSAILAQQERPDLAAVAGTAGAATWRDEWTRQVVETEPSWVLIWYDADEAGRTNGQRVAERLRAAGLTVRVYQWPRGTAEHRDLADVLAEGGEIPIPMPAKVVDYAYV